jgi:hypothetical protein
LRSLGAGQLGTFETVGVARIRLDLVKDRHLHAGALQVNNDGLDESGGNNSRIGYYHHNPRTERFDLVGQAQDHSTPELDAGRHIERSVGSDSAAGAREGGMNRLSRHHDSSFGYTATRCAVDV